MGEGESAVHMSVKEKEVSVEERSVREVNTEWGGRGAVVTF